MYMEKLMKLSKQDKLNIAFLYVESQVHSVENEFLKKSNLDITHRELIYIVFINLFKNEKMSTIAKVLSVSKSTFSNMVNTLIRKGMVEKTRVSKDSRVLTLELTKKSLLALELHNKARNLVNNSVKETASIQEKEMLNSISEKVLIKIKEDLKK